MSIFMVNYEIKVKCDLCKNIMLFDLEEDFGGVVPKIGKKIENQVCHDYEIGGGGQSTTFTVYKVTKSA